jgi:hypothetical protein
MVERARQPFEHEHVCPVCFKTVVCFLQACTIDYASGQWLGALMPCFDCGADEAVTATRGRSTVPER